MEWRKVLLHTDTEKVEIFPGNDILYQRRVALANKFQVNSFEARRENEWLLDRDALWFRPDRLDPTCFHDYNCRTKYVVSISPTKVRIDQVGDDYYLLEILVDKDENDDDDFQTQLAWCWWVDVKKNDATCYWFGLRDDMINELKKNALAMKLDRFGEHPQYDHYWDLAHCNLPNHGFHVLETADNSCQLINWGRDHWHYTKTYHFLGDRILPPFKQLVDEALNETK